MKILALADIHKRKIKNLPEADVVFIVGDFTNADDPSFVENLLDAIDAKVYAVPGNMDREEVLEILEERNVSVHLKSKKLDGLTVVGLGGSNLTPFNTPFELSEEEINKALSTSKGDIAIFHTPPYGIFDWVRGNSVGSKAVKDWMDKMSPKLLICAHIHEHKGVARYNDTLIIKLGAAVNGDAVVIETNDELNPLIIKFINI